MGRRLAAGLRRSDAIHTTADTEQYGAHGFWIVCIRDAGAAGSFRPSSSSSRRRRGSPPVRYGKVGRNAGLSLACTRIRVLSWVWRVVEGMNGEERTKPEVAGPPSLTAGWVDVKVTTSEEACPGGGWCFDTRPMLFPLRRRRRRNPNFKLNAGFSTSGPCHRLSVGSRVSPACFRGCWTCPRRFPARCLLVRRSMHWRRLGQRQQMARCLLVGLWKDI